MCTQGGEKGTRCQAHSGYTVPGPGRSTGYTYCARSIRNTVSGPGLWGWGTVHRVLLNHARPTPQDTHTGPCPGASTGYTLCQAHKVQGARPWRGTLCQALEWGGGSTKYTVSGPQNTPCQALGWGGEGAQGAFTMPSPQGAPCQAWEEHRIRIHCAKPMVYTPWRAKLWEEHMVRRVSPTPQGTHASRQRGAQGTLCQAISSKN